MTELVRRSLPSWLHASLSTAQLVGFLMLLRSVAFDRWMTVVVSLGLIVGARAAMRARTWGLFAVLAAAAWYASAFVLGMAHPWFVLLATFAAMPFFKSWGALRGFDRRAAAVGAGLAASTGFLGAFAWKALAPWLFWNLPALRPTLYAGHGLALAAIAATAVVVALRDRRARDAEEAAEEGASLAAGDEVHARIASPVRVTDELRDATDDELAEHTLDADEVEDDADETRRARR